MSAITIAIPAVEVNAVEVNVPATPEVRATPKHSISCARRHAARHGLRMTRQAAGFYRLTCVIAAGRGWYQTRTVASHLSTDAVVTLCQQWDEAAAVASWKGLDTLARRAQELTAADLAGKGGSR
jgi:hypothetical protein